MDLTAPQLGDPRILVVDDNRNFRNMMRAMLRHFGMRHVDIVEDPGHVIRHLSQNFVDIAFIDAMMPGLSGPELIKAIRHCPKLANRAMPIAIVSGHADKTLVRVASKVGADLVLVKPVSPRLVFERLNLLLKRPNAYVHGADGYYGPDVDAPRMGRPERPPSRLAGKLAGVVPRDGVSSVPGFNVAVKDDEMAFLD